MRRSIGFFSAMALILGLALAACGGTPTGSDPERRLSFEGSVTSAADGAPIQGATVKFVKHGRTRVTTFAEPVRPHRTHPVHRIHPLLFLFRAFVGPRGRAPRGGRPRLRLVLLGAHVHDGHADD